MTFTARGLLAGSFQPAPRFRGSRVAACRPRCFSWLDGTPAADVTLSVCPSSAGGRGAGVALRLLRAVCRERCRVRVRTRVCTSPARTPRTGLPGSWAAAVTALRSCQVLPGLHPSAAPPRVAGFRFLHALFFCFLPFDGMQLWVTFPQWRGARRKQGCPCPDPSCVQALEGRQPAPGPRPLSLPGTRGGRSCPPASPSCGRSLCGVRNCPLGAVWPLTRAPRVVGTVAPPPQPDSSCTCPVPLKAHLGRHPPG